MTVDCRSHLILSTYVGRGPTADTNLLKRTLRTLPPSVKIKSLLGDAGFDSEENHCYVCNDLGIQSMIPPNPGRGRPKKGHFRRLMHLLFNKQSPTIFKRRWQVETTFSMLKRNLGEALSGKNYWSQCRDLWLKTITHNLMIAAEN